MHRVGGFLFDARAAGWLMPLVARRQTALLGLFGMGLVAAAIGLIPPWLTKLIIDQGLVAGDVAALVQWCVVLVGVGLLSLVLGALSSILHMRASVAMLADLRALLARTVLARSPAWRAERQTGDLLARLDGDAGEVQQFAFNALLTGSGALVRLVGGAVMLFVLSWELALIACLLAPAEILFFAYARPRTERLAHEVRSERGTLASGFAEMLSGLMQIQSAGGEPVVASRLATQQGGLNAALLRAQLWGEVTRGVPMLLTALVRAAILLIGGLMVIRDGWPLGSLIAFLAYLGFLTGPAQSLIGLWHAQARMRAALDRLGGIMVPEKLHWPASPVRLPEGPGALRCEGLTLRIAGRDLMTGVDLYIPGGTRVRVAGDSGSGKSSFLALLQRHADPTAGRVLLDGVDVRTLSREDLRRAVMLVPQRPFLMRTSVAENLRLSCPQATDAELASMLDLVRLSDRCAPDAQLGEDGLTLSGGERQRLCLARALLTPFRVLILDEALSEVDPDTAASILDAIDERWPHATCLIAAHGGPGAGGVFDMSIELGALQGPR